MNVNNMKDIRYSIYKNWLENSKPGNRIKFERDKITIFEYLFLEQFNRSYNIKLEKKIIKIEKGFIKNYLDLHFIGTLASRMRVHRFARERPFNLKSNFKYESFINDRHNSIRIQENHVNKFFGLTLLDFKKKEIVKEYALLYGKKSKEISYLGVENYLKTLSLTIDELWGEYK